MNFVSEREVQNKNMKQTKTPYYNLDIVSIIGIIGGWISMLFFITIFIIFLWLTFIGV